MRLPNGFSLSSRRCCLRSLSFERFVVVGVSAVDLKKAP